MWRSTLLPWIFFLDQGLDVLVPIVAPKTIVSRSSLVFLLQNIVLGVFFRAHKMEFFSCRADFRMKVGLDDQALRRSSPNHKV
jgi:hypothetical protein